MRGADPFERFPKLGRLFSADDGEAFGLSPEFLVGYDGVDVRVRNRIRGNTTEQ